MIGTIEMYSMKNCPYCEKAKKLLYDNKIMYKYYMLDENYTKQELAERLGVDATSRITLPQIFLDNESIGGYNELKMCMDAVHMMKYMQENGL